jgi:hypothetical protein
VNVNLLLSVSFGRLCFSCCCTSTNFSKLPAANASELSIGLWQRFSQLRGAFREPENDSCLHKGIGGLFFDFLPRLVATKISSARPHFARVSMDALT